MSQCLACYCYSASLLWQYHFLLCIFCIHLISLKHYGKDLRFYLSLVLEAVGLPTLRGYMLDQDKYQITSA